MRELFVKLYESQKWIPQEFIFDKKNSMYPLVMATITIILWYSLDVGDYGITLLRLVQTCGSN